MPQPKSDLATLAAVARGVAVALTVAALYFAKDVFIPLTLGLLLSFLLTPLVVRLQRWHISNMLAVIATAALTFVVLAAMATLIGRELSALAGELPKHKHELIAKARGVAGLTNGVSGSLDELANEVSDAMDGEEAETEDLPPPTLLQSWGNRFLPPPAAAGEQADLPNDGTTAKRPLYVQPVASDLPLASWATTAGFVLGPLATAGLVSVFAMFILVYRADLRDRIIAVVSGGNYVTTTEALNEAGVRISRYLLAQTIVNTSYGLVLAIGLSLIGASITDEGVFPNAILWGVLATCLRFVPYIGPVAAASFPLAIALSVFPGYGVFAAVLVLIVVMELLSNNVLEPWLYGASTGISAVAVIVAAVFWGWLWGPVGLLLSTPLTVCLVVLGRYVPSFRLFDTLLGENFEIKTYLRVYQRLLAGDDRGASEILLRYADDHGLDRTCDQVLVPALKRIRWDHRREYLTDVDSNRLLSLTAGVIAELHDHLHPPSQLAADHDLHSSEAARKQLPTVIGCTTHHLSEALIVNLLRSGGESTFQLNAEDQEASPEDLAQRIIRHDPAVVVIVVLPPGGFAQARCLCRAVRAENYAGPIIVACLGKFKHFDKLFVRFRRAGATSLTTTYSQTLLRVASLTRSSRTRAPQTEPSQAPSAVAP